MFLKSNNYRLSKIPLKSTVYLNPYFKIVELRKLPYSEATIKTLQKGVNQS